MAPLKLILEAQKNTRYISKKREVRRRERDKEIIEIRRKKMTQKDIVLCRETRPSFS
jgi:hypothetical protein